MPVSESAGDDNTWLNNEYFALFQAVGDFDGRILTVKGWGVTVGLASLGFGFQYGHYGLFLVAILSSLSFWAIETAMKRHQMRYYVRMRQIEVLRYRQRMPDDARESSPLIDWTWGNTPDGWRWEPSGYPKPEYYGQAKWFHLAFLLPHVFLPHALTLIAGLVLLSLGLGGALDPAMKW